MPEYIVTLRRVTVEAYRVPADSGQEAWDKINTDAEHYHDTLQVYSVDVERELAGAIKIQA